MCLGPDSNGPLEGKPPNALVPAENLCLYPLLSDVLDAQVTSQACAAQQPNMPRGTSLKDTSGPGGGPEQPRPAPVPPGRTAQQQPIEALPSQLPMISPRSCSKSQPS